MTSTKIVSKKLTTATRVKTRGKLSKSQLASPWVNVKLRGIFSAACFQAWKYFLRKPCLDQ